ncbi:MAG: hypothetical protein WAM30_00555 [Candidatus Dormiibacterota bacterium]|jgi:hypothetical protein
MGAATGHLLAGLVMGLLAIVLGIGLWIAAIQRRRHRDRSAATYRGMGGPVYTVAQSGCATTAIVAGLIILVWAFLGR